MKTPTPIPGSVNEKGMFTAENICHSKYHRQEYSELYPPLFCYTTSNVLVTDEEHVEVVKGSYVTIADCTIILRNGQAVDYYKDAGYEVQPCYITIPPTDYEIPDKSYDWYSKQIPDGQRLNVEKREEENDLIQLQKTLRDLLFVRPFDITAIENAAIKLCDSVTDAKPFKAVDEPEAQPLEGVKTAEISQPKKTPAEIWVHQYLLNEGWDQNSFGVISAEFEGGSCNLTYVIAHALEAFNAQFATDAQQLKHENDALYIRINELETRLSAFATDAGGVDIDAMAKDRYPNHQQSDFDRGGVIGFITGYKQALSAPSTHSSSEMVEVEKVVSLVSNFYKGSSCYSEMLINQIRTKK